MPLERVGGVDVVQCDTTGKFLNFLLRKSSTGASERLV